MQHCRTRKPLETTVWKKIGNEYPNAVLLPLGNLRFLISYTSQSRMKIEVKCKADCRLIQIPNGHPFIANSITHNSLHFSPQATVPCKQNNNYCQFRFSTDINYIGHGTCKGPENRSYLIWCDSTVVCSIFVFDQAL